MRGQVPDDEGRGGAAGVGVSPRSPRPLKCGAGRDMSSVGGAEFGGLMLLPLRTGAGGQHTSPAEYHVSHVTATPDCTISIPGPWVTLPSLIFLDHLFDLCPLLDLHLTPCLTSTCLDPNLTS